MPRATAAIGGLDGDGPPGSSAEGHRLVGRGGCGSEHPGAPATPGLLGRRRELILSPMTSMASGGGPMNVTPRSVMARAKSVFSEKKP